MLFVNDTAIDVTHFPDGTSQVWKLPENIFLKKEAMIKWTFAHEGEFMHLAQLKRLLNQHGISCSLELTYLPYGRQDKQVSNETTFALNTFASLLNHLNFYEVICTDPHSEAADRLINHFRAVYPVKLVETICQTMFDDGAPVLCYPDKGALNKYSKEYASLYRPHIYGEKVRDQLTGNITSYKLVGECAGKNVLIVDDICDGGMTFKLLAKDLLAAGAKEVNLFVTHGIFSKGLRPLKDAGIKRIFTQDGEASTYQDQIMYRRLS